MLQNLMVFRTCSIGGKAYRGDEEALDEITGDRLKTSAVFEEIIPVDNLASRPSGSRLTLDSPPQQTLGTSEKVDRFTDSVLSQDIQAASKGWTDHTSVFTPSAALNGFFTVLSLCHTAIAAPNPETGYIDYKAQSPDEAALVRAAADAGYVFLGKEKDLLLLKTPRSDAIEQYELLDILDFTSARKRMSAIVRRVDAGAKDNDHVLLLAKGADNVIFERLRPGDKELKADTEDHLSEFANNGLRTLTLAYRIVPSALSNIFV